jgi:hypothetical protein
MKRYIYCTAIFAMMLYACNKGSSRKIQDVPLQDQTNIAQNKNETPQQVTDQAASTDTAAAPTEETDNNVAAAKNNDEDWDKKIVKNADLQLQVDDYKKFNTSIHNSLKQYGAYVAEEKQQQTDYRIENSLTIKVPVTQFDDLVNSLGGDGIKIMEKNISSEDVTTEVVDTKARLQAKLAVREKYLQLLKQARNMNEILQVQNEINEIQENIEAANGRINYLQHASAYSTINLEYYQFINGSTAADEKPDFFTRFTSAFSTGTSFLGEIVLFGLSIWPLILLLLAFWLYFKKLKVKKAYHS